jgi:uncharacterized glyoxalase superfamily protein PhnB
MPNLENLRKQAKLVLRRHRDRYYPVAAQIRIALPRFSHLRDPEILAHPFKLADAQQVVAREHGFESWQALKQGLPTMSDQVTKTAPAVVLSGAEPQLFVADINASCDYFVSKLGFSIVFTYGEPAYYAQVKRDAARLNFRCVDSPVIDLKLRDQKSLLSAAITVDTADAIKRLFLEYRSGGAFIHQALRTEPWGARNFIVKDPDGNLLLFAGPAE